MIQEAAYGAGAVTSLAGAFTQAQAQQDQASFAAAQYKQNQKIALAQGALAESIGDKNASIAAKQGQAQVGDQRLAAAASGIDVNSGSAAGLQADTEYQSQLNQMTIKNNAWREAWGYQMQAAGAGTQAQMAMLAGNNQANSTLLTGGMNALNFGFKGLNAYNNDYGGTKTTPFTDSNFTMPTFGSKSTW